MSVQIQLKRSTASAWTSTNPTLASGEIGYETDTAKFKIGNGSTAWTSLSYANANLSAASLDALSDVTITSATNGDFLRWNGSAWINDAVNLSTDTIGSYVESLVAGTGVTLTNNSGEGATPTIAVNTSVIQARVADVSDTEIGYLNGVTSAIQTQIDTKAPLASPTFTGTVTVPTPVNNTDASTKTYVDSTASTTAGNAATALTNHEADTTNIHGIADTSILVTTTGTQTLTNKTITTPAGLVKGDVGLGNVDNTSDANKPVSSAGQTALDLKAPLASPTFTGTVVLPDNTVALGTKTTGDYVATITGGTGITSTAATTGEGTTHSLSIGQAVGTTDNVTFAGVTADAITIGITAAGEIDTTSGNLTIDSAGGTVTVDDNLTVTGNLTVSGTTTSINTETLTIDDNIIVLNNNVTSTPSENAGIEVERGTSANVLIRWNETSDKWEATNDGSVYGNIVTSADSGTITSAMILDGTIVDADINASAAIVDTKLSTITTAGKVSNSATTATDANTASAIVARDASGNFVAGTITAALTGNASTATTLATSRNIAGQSFNGSANISIAPTDLTGVTSTAAEINILDGATLSTTELNYVDGVTSAIQTQIDTKAPLASPAFTGTVTLPSGTVTSAMIADATIVDGDISSSAAIADSKLATISTAGKVSNSATTATATAGNSTIVARDASGNFAAGTITAALSGNASTATTLATTRAIEISGDVTGTANFDGSAAINIVTTIAANSVALGTDTTGNYVNDITAGTGVSVTHTPGEGTSPTIAIGQAVATNSNVTFNDLTVSGNLTVSGTTTSINTETLTVDDNIVILNNNVTGSPTENAGIEVERGTSANVSVRWNETNDKWEITNDGTTYGNIVSTSDTGTVATAMIADSNVTTGKINDLAVTTGKINDLAVTNAKISESAAIVDTKLATISTAGKVSNSATTATDANTANAIVARDASGNFTAGTITGALSGNASTATTLATARNIAGQSFNGSANISIAPTDLTGVTSTAAEINILDGATLSTAELNILDGVTASASELNILDGALLSTTELNYVDGVTSAIQTQIDSKAPTSSPTFTGTVSGITQAMVGLGNVNDTSDINKPVSTAQQTALNLKANLNSPSFSGTPSLPSGTTAFTQGAGDNTTAIATTAFIQTAIASFGVVTVSDTAPTVDVSAGDFWYDSTGLNLYIYYGSSWVQITIDEPILFELSELIGVVIDDLLPNQTLRFDGVSGNWVNSAPRQNIANSSLTTYGVTSTDSGGLIVLDSSSAISVNLGTWTNANVGEKVDIVQKGTGQVTVTVSGSVSVVSPGNSVATRARYSTVTATCIGVNLFLLSGDLA